MSSAHQAIMMAGAGAVGNVATGPGAPGTVARWDAAYTGANITLSLSNSKARSTTAGYHTSRSTVAMVSGKWCFEYQITATDSLYLGITNGVTGSTFLSPPAASYWDFGGYISGATGVPVSGAYFAAGEFITLAVDVEARLVKYYQNGVLRATVTAPGTGVLYAFFGGSNSGVGAEATLTTSVIYPVAGFQSVLTNT